MLPSGTSNCFSPRVIFTSFSYGRNKGPGLDMVLILMDFDFVENKAATGRAHPDFGLISRSLQPLLASLFRSEGFRSPLEPFPTVAQIKASERYMSTRNTNDGKKLRDHAESLR